MPGDDGGDKIANWKLYTLMGLMLVFGSANTLIQKYQDDTVLPGEPKYKDSKPGDLRKYSHPYFQCATMFTGELCCLIVYGVKRYVLSKRQSEYDKEAEAGADAVPPSSPGTQLATAAKLRTNINPLWFAIPALFDCTASSLMFAALTEVAASVY